MRAASQSRLAGGFIAILALIAIAIGAFLLQDRSSDAVRHALQVDGHLARVLSTLQDAETGQRGFLLTGDETFLAPFSSSVGKLTHQLERLRALVADNPEQLRSLDALDRVARDKLDELETSIKLRQGGQEDAATRLVAEGRGKRMMDEIRSLLARMDDHEDALMEQRRARAAHLALALWLCVTATVAMIVAFAILALREAGRRAQLARFLPEELADRLADPRDGLTAGRRQVATIAFIDMRGSTALAESLEPHLLREVLTTFRGHIAAAARLHGGVIDKFIGDGALVVFGLPEPRPDDAARALAFAQALVVALDARPLSQGAQTPSGIGIGLHCGEVFCGLVGEASRCEFTVIGDTVNVAARLEQETKAHGVPILASAALFIAAGTRAEDWREIGRARLRGRRGETSYGAPVARDASVPKPAEPS